jgi:hypothetical protein
MRLARHVAPMRKKCIQNLIRKPENETIETTRHKWDGIKTGLEGISSESVSWIHLARNRDQWQALVNTVMNLRCSVNVGNLFNGCATVSFSRRTHSTNCFTFINNVPIRVYIVSALTASLNNNHKNINGQLHGFS